MTYEEFVDAANGLILQSFAYSVDQVGSGFFLEKAAALDDQYPEFARKMMEES